MEKVFVAFLQVLLSLYVCNGQDSSSYLFTNDSIHISGRIIGFDPGQDDKFISFQTYGIDGESKRTAVQIARDGGFHFTGYQPFKGNNTVSYRGAYIWVYTSPGDPLTLEIDNAKINRSKHHKNAFRAEGKLADLNNQLFAFQTAADEMRFDTLSSLGDKTQTDSVFAVRRKKRLDAEISFLDEYAKRTAINAILLNWLRNQYIYTAGYEISFYPFLGKLNRKISIAQMKGFLDFLQIDNPEAMDNSAYYQFLNGFSVSLRIIVNLSPSYQAEIKNQGYNLSAFYLDKAAEVTGGIAGQLLVLNMYPQIGKAGIAANLIFGRFETIVQEPWLKKELLRRKADDLAGFNTYDVTERIRELKVTDAFKQRLLSIFAKEKGNNIYLDFWADWCGPCMLEMPNYPALIAELKDQPLKFIFMSALTNEDSMIAIKNKYGIKADFYNLTKEEVAIVNNAFQFQAYPSHFVINREGKVVGSFVAQVGSKNISERAATIKKTLAL